MTADYLIFIIYSVSGGILLAFIVSLILKALFGSFIEALINKNAFDESSAKTLEELEIKSNKMLLFAIKKNSSLKKLICITDSNRYYLPNENKLKAERFYLRENFSLLTVIILTALVAVVYFICDKVIPNIM